MFGGRILGRSSAGGFVVSEDCLPAVVRTSEYGSRGWGRAGVLEGYRGSAKLVPALACVGGGEGLKVLASSL